MPAVGADGLAAGTLADLRLHRRTALETHGAGSDHGCVDRATFSVQHGAAAMGQAGIEMKWHGADSSKKGMVRHGAHRPGRSANADCRGGEKMHPSPHPPPKHP